MHKLSVNPGVVHQHLRSVLAQRPFSTSPVSFTLTFCFFEKGRPLGEMTNCSRLFVNATLLPSGVKGSKEVSGTSPLERRDGNATNFFVEHIYPIRKSLTKQRVGDYSL